MPWNERRVRPGSAPTGGDIAVCPHCWGVNPHALRLCARCGADMTMALQESGGLRWSAPVQSPMPVRTLRLGRVQRAALFAFAALLAVATLLAALAPVAALRPRAPVPAAAAP